jgi:hypothetical protein
MCVHRQVTGIDFDGGYAEYMIARADTLAAIPEALPAEEAGPLMCAGVTVYSALRNAGVRAGEVVAVRLKRFATPSRPRRGHVTGRVVDVSVTNAAPP